eukprot:7650377-Pyramimonas_sp.AAC.1
MALQRHLWRDVCAGCVAPARGDEGRERERRRAAWAAHGDGRKPRAVLARPRARRQRGHQPAAAPPDIVHIGPGIYM